MNSLMKYIISFFLIIKVGTNSQRGYIISLDIQVKHTLDNNQTKRNNVPDDHRDGQM